MAAMSRRYPMNARSRADLDHARAQGFEAYYRGETPADTPHDEFSGLVRDWWLSGWRAARAADQPRADR